MAQKQGADQPKRPERRQPAPNQGGGSDRTSPTQFFSEVRGELRKVAWPTRQETLNYSLIVFVALVILMAFVGLMDYAFGEFVLRLFNS